MTSVKRHSFIFWLAGALLLSSMLAFKPMPSRQQQPEEGVYVVAKSRLYDDDSQFRLDDTLVYHDLVEEGFDPSINQTNKDMALGHDGRTGRCTKCHECGFERAWDMEHYETPEWNPTYVGEQWQPIVMRMRRLENAFINEQIGDRIYSFLRDETLGVYDESKDTKGATVINLDKAQPVPRTP